MEEQLCSVILISKLKEWVKMLEGGATRLVIMEIKENIDNGRRGGIIEVLSQEDGMQMLYDSIDMDTTTENECEKCTRNCSHSRH